MSKYEYLMGCAEKCKRIAAGSKNLDITLFYINAAEGYKSKAEKLTIEEAEKLV